MAIVTKAFSFAEGPHSTQMTHEQIASAVTQVATEQRFVNFMQRNLLKPKPNHYYGAFAPTDDDEPFVLDGNRRADWRAGWCREYKEFSQQQGIRDVGWRVIFEVFDIGPARHVVASVQGKSERNEVKRFVQQVFDRLARP